MSHPTRTLIALAVLLAAGCSSGGGNDDGPPPAATLREDWAQQLAEWLCDDLAACCAGTGQSFDRERCVAVKRAAELRRVEREEARSTRVFDEAQARACLARLDAQAPACGTPYVDVRECFRAFDGVVELGEPSSHKNACRGALSGDVACIAGRCTTRLAAGEPCPEPTGDVGRCDVCRPGARCARGRDGGHYCFAIERRRGVAGDPCNEELVPPDDPSEVTVVAECADQDGLYCSVAGVCTPHVALGEPCLAAFECGLRNRCAGGVCAPRVVAGEGRRCAGVRDCADGLHCEASPGESIGICVALPSACTTGLEKLERQAARMSQ